MRRPSWLTLSLRKTAEHWTQPAAALTACVLESKLWPTPSNSQFDEDNFRSCKTASRVALLTTSAPTIAGTWLAAHITAFRAAVVPETPKADRPIGELTLVAISSQAQHSTSFANNHSNHDRVPVAGPIPLSQKQLSFHFRYTCFTTAELLSPAPSRTPVQCHEAGRPKLVAMEHWKTNLSLQAFMPARQSNSLSMVVCSICPLWHRSFHVSDMLLLAAANLNCAITTWCFIWAVRSWWWLEKHIWVDSESALTAVVFLFTLGHVSPHSHFPIIYNANTTAGFLLLVIFTISCGLHLVHICWVRCSVMPRGLHVVISGILAGGILGFRNVHCCFAPTLGHLLWFLLPLFLWWPAQFTAHKRLY